MNIYFKCMERKMAIPVCNLKTVRVGHLGLIKVENNQSPYGLALFIEYKLAASSSGSFMGIPKEP